MSIFIEDWYLYIPSVHETEDWWMSSHRKYKVNKQWLFEEIKEEIKDIADDALDMDWFKI